MTRQSDLVARRSGAWIDDDGRVYADRPVARGHAHTVDLTALYQDAARTTADPDTLVIEAELYDERGTVGNAARPANDAVEQAARERIDERGLVPAWEVGE